MQPGDIYLNDVLLPAGSRTVTPQPVEIVRQSRAASGRLLEDVIRRYVNWQIDYEIMTGPDYELLLSLYELGQHLPLKIVHRDGSITESLVKVHPITATRELIAGEWIWSGVSVLLEAV